MNQYLAQGQERMLRYEIILYIYAKLSYEQHEIQLSISQKRKEAEQALTVWLPFQWINQITAGLRDPWPLLGK